MMFRPTAASAPALEIPNLLSADGIASSNPELLDELLELAFLGSSKPGPMLDGVLSEFESPPTSWNEAFFADELFLSELIEGCMPLVIAGSKYPAHRRYLARVLSRPPISPRDIDQRQAILRELSDDEGLRSQVETLYLRLHRLLCLFKAPGMTARLDQAAFRLEILQQARQIVEAMVDEFATARSEVSRLHFGGKRIQESEPFKLLLALLDWEGHLSDLTLQVRMAPDGRIRSLSVEAVSENRASRFYRSPAARWLDQLRLAWMGLRPDRREMVNRVITQVYLEIAPAVRSLLGLIGQLEFYLCSLGFRELANRRGLAVDLADVHRGPSLALEDLFNPLLLRQEGRPVPCSVATYGDRAITVVTGPNSGGKTRMLQAVGLAQILGQSGIFVPAARASLPLRTGLFVSLVERTSADQCEGRLGTELLRIRQLFEDLRPGALVLLDELCSGTNPSEASEILRMVLRLLDRIRPIAFVTTHFLDFTRELRGAGHGWTEKLAFLQVEVDPSNIPTYRFLEGVAETSLASDTARRLGVTHEELCTLLQRSLESYPTDSLPAVSSNGTEPNAQHGVSRQLVTIHEGTVAYGRL